ncbi:MAG: LysM peptidoglycan-binding domain-containing protein [Ulvibacter sp.]|nr:LysM peptidoglycan-binding domain-containing protein [Ulvibacter sp.]|tara:strand:+ start:137 stop:2044 length:1908 start_codon:yes stop_codon:yes gene_type:complete
MATAQKEYETHRVQKNQSLSQIATLYGVSQAAIKKRNPEIENELSAGTLLIIPTQSKSIDAQNPPKFKKHKVRRKETLITISKKYNVSIDAIKRYNKQLYARQIKKGERLQIPMHLKIVDSGVVPYNDSKVSGAITLDTSSLSKHIVKAKETRYGIARMYGITVSELEQMNPELGEGLSQNAIINVPSKAILKTAIAEKGYRFYEVQPKEGFYRLKVKINLTKEQIVALNPYAKDGLQEGMILKIPSDTATAITGQVNKRDLQQTIIDTSQKRIAVLLPFRLNKIISDSLSVKQQQIKKNRLMSLSLDFYSGLLMATEFAKDKGISLQLDVFDTQYNTAIVSDIINSNTFDNFDAVIGPLGQKNIEKAAAMLQDTTVPIFSPLSNKQIKVSKNVFQSLPSDVMLEDGMLQYIVSGMSDKNVIVITDSTKTAQLAKIMLAIPDARIVSLREEGFLRLEDVENQIDQTKENWVILEATDPILISNVVGVLNGLPVIDPDLEEDQEPVDYEIRLFSLDKNAAFDYHDVSNVHLAELNFTFPSVNKSYNYKDKNAFLISYKNKYGVLPNRFAVRGFDLTYDVILRLASSEDIFTASKQEFETQYIENKFSYSKSLLSGYQNNAFYIIKYQENLQFQVLE